MAILINEMTSAAIDEHEVTHRSKLFGNTYCDLECGGANTIGFVPVDS